MKVSFITTVYNEETTISALLESVFKQSKLPDEIIIVDGGSSDRTVTKIKSEKLKIKNYDGKFKIIVKKGNRAVGRNEAIGNASNEIIVCSDAGCILDKNWVKNIIEPFNDPKVDVVAGYYKGKPKNIFQKCLVPYVLVTEDKLNPAEFLPATRSMAFKKSVWKKVGGFDEKYSHNEDYVFAQKLKKTGTNIIFEGNAVVYWIPRKNIKDAFIMFFRFAVGDSEAKILRLKVALIFTRYLIGAYLLFFGVIEKSYLLLYGTLISIALYLAWSVFKNYKYVNNYKAILFLPILQFVSDAAVLLGTSMGFLKRVKVRNIVKIFKNNRAISLMILFYISIMIYLINWGIPNLTHPFPYHMDEWHQLQAVRGVFSHGTPNIPGAAHGPLFHFIISGILLLPFVAIGFINPFAIYSSVTQLQMQEKLFIAFRFETLFFGVMSIIVLAKIIKENFKTNPFWMIFFFIVSPVWLSLSNYFKYDIALTFWILLSFFFLLRYARYKSILYFFISGLTIGLTISTKFTAVPLVLIYGISFFLFPPKQKKILTALIGIVTFIAIFLLVGIPDVVFFQRGDYDEFIYSNLMLSPSSASNFALGMNIFQYLLIRSFPLTFGQALWLLFSLALIYWVIRLFNPFQKIQIYLYGLYKREIFVLISFLIFALSLIPLGLTATNNRVLVLLPFIIIILAFTYKNVLISLSKKLKIIFYLLLFILMLIQAIESYAWIIMKVTKSPQETSSNWISKNISEGSEIGIENTPIYQSLPDIIVKEFYDKQYNIQGKQKYRYKIINEKSVILPNLIVISNADSSTNYLKESSKNDLINRLKIEKYNLVKNFPLNLTLLKYFGSKMDYFINSMGAMPTEISIYRK